MARKYRTSKRSHSKKRYSKRRTSSSKRRISSKRSRSKRRRSKTRSSKRGGQKGGFFNPLSLVSSIVDNYIVGNKSNTTAAAPIPDQSPIQQTNPVPIIDENDKKEAFTGGSNKNLNHIYKNLNKLKLI